MPPYLPCVHASRWVRFLPTTKITSRRGSGSCLVVRAVASNSRAPWFKPNHRQNFIMNIYLLTVKNMIINKKMPRMAHFNHYIRNSFFFVFFILKLTGTLCKNVTFLWVLSMWGNCYAKSFIQILFFFHLAILLVQFSLPSASDLRLRLFHHRRLAYERALF